MVATNADLATRAGVAILQRGGNAFDAAIAAAFALAVVHPLAGNLGGGGFLVLRTASGKIQCIDFRETAPRAATREMYFGDGESARQASRTGHLAVGVPGTVDGLGRVAQEYAQLPWRDLIEPAIRLAGDGFEVSQLFHDSIQRNADRLERFPASAAVYLPDGKPPDPGTRWSNPDLAATLMRIAERGPREFYQGETAHLLAGEMRRGGGIIDAEDLKRYRSLWRDPVEFEYRGYRVISAPPPSSGGLVLALIAGILEGFDLEGMGWHSPESLHLMAEAMRRAFALRNRDLGDPDFVSIPAGRFLSAGAAARQRESIDPDRATPSTDDRFSGTEDFESGSTTHVSVVDRSGNAVALTTTLNSWFGSAVVVEGAGFVLNNEMDDFATRPGEGNLYGLIHGEANAVAPGRRMLSSMTPTIVLDPAGRPFLVTGAAGGPRIISAVFQVLSNVIDHGMTIGEAVNAPRIHHQHLPDRIAYDPDGLTADLVRALEERGHRVEPSRMHIGYAPSILRAGDLWTGSGEPRRPGGLAMGFDPPIDFSRAP